MTFSLVSSSILSILKLFLSCYSKFCVIYSGGGAKLEHLIAVSFFQDLSSITNLVNKLCQEFLIEFKKLGDLRKISNLALDMAHNSSQKKRKIRNQTFLLFSKFTGFHYIVPNILS